MSKLVTKLQRKNREFEKRAAAEQAQQLAKQAEQVQRNLAYNDENKHKYLTAMIEMIEKEADQGGKASRLRCPCNEDAEYASGKLVLDWLIAQLQKEGLTAKFGKEWVPSCMDEGSEMGAYWDTWIDVRW